MSGDACLTSIYTEKKLCICSVLFIGLRIKYWWIPRREATLNRRILQKSGAWKINLEADDKGIT